MNVQLDLFGAVERRLRQEAERDAQAREVANDRERERVEWTARFERADWMAPYDTAGGMKAGESVLGWRCPDPECGEIESNGFLLTINHGFDPGVPGHEPFDGRCSQLRRSGGRRP
jgi:hypothetical protein